jgi:hypothetical protein
VALPGSPWRYINTFWGSSWPKAISGILVKIPNVRRNSITVIPMTLNFIPILDSIFEWLTIPILHPMRIEGLTQFLLFAKGNLQQVRFTGYITVNGVDISNPMTTDAQDLNETTETTYISTPINITQPVELNYTDTIGLRLTVQHNDPQWYTPPPLGTGGKNVSLVMGSFNFPAQVVFAVNSMEITKIESEEVSGFIRIWATIACGFGVEDFSWATARSEYGTLRFESETILDEATGEYEWEWDYSEDVQEGGSYPVEVTARDQSYNSWQKTEDIHVTTVDTEVDFSLGSSSISFSPDPKRDINTTIKAKITGGGKRWSTFNVDVEFYDNSELIESVTWEINRAETNLVEVTWIPDEGGKHTILVIVDPEDEISETNEHNNEVEKTVDVASGSEGGSPGFELPLLFAAFALVILFNIRRKYRK